MLASQGGISLSFQERDVRIAFTADDDINCGKIVLEQSLRFRIRDQTTRRNVKRSLAAPVCFGVLVERRRDRRVPCDKVSTRGIAKINLRRSVIIAVRYRPECFRMGGV